MTKLRKVAAQLAARLWLAAYQSGQARKPKSSWVLLSEVPGVGSETSADFFVVSSTPVRARDCGRLVAALERSSLEWACGVEVSPSGAFRRLVRVVAAGYEIGVGESGSILLPLMDGVSLLDWSQSTTTAPMASGGPIAIRSDVLTSVLGGETETGSASLDLRVALARRGECLVVWSVVIEDAASAEVLVPVEMGLARRTQGDGSRVRLASPTVQSPGNPAPPPAAVWLGSVQHARSPGADRVNLRPTVCIRHAATDWAVAAKWGDQHFADDLASAFERESIGARVVPRHAWDHPFAARPLVITLRGLHPSTPIPGSCNVLWVISHPEDLTRSELDSHDLIAVASVRDTARIQGMTRTPVVPLLQATEFNRFCRPHREKVFRPLYVGNSRGIARAGAVWAIATGLEPVIHGSGWEGILPEGSFSGPVSNTDLPDIFNSHGLVIADHWETMKELGYLSNRVFDALAAGSLVVSDKVSELDEILPGVPTYDSPEELSATVRRWSHDGQSQLRSDLVGSLQAAVRSHHTFDVRVIEIMAAIEQRVAGGGELVRGLRSKKVD